MFDEKVDHVVVLVRMLFHFVDDDYDFAVVYMKNEEEEEEEQDELVDDEMKQQVVNQV